ncbi:MAG: GntR family transcriptional regulator [Gordonia sp. (in: high G+C Gram-positive bacteria)]
MGASDASSAGLKQAAAAELRRRIFGGELRPGAKIDQDAIAEWLGISKLPVREALIALASEGIVENIPRRGAFVAHLSREDIIDHYWMLGVISGIAAERAAVRLDDAALERMADLARRMEEGDPDVTADDLNVRFHRVINVAAGSRRLISQLRLLSNSIPGGFYHEHPEVTEWALRDHREILGALAARSGGIARTLVEGHFLRGGHQAVTQLERQGFWD